MILLAIDPATITGFALGSPGATPTWGARDFGRGKTNGEVISAFRHWLNALAYREKPGLIAFEAPYIAAAGPRKPGGPPPQNIATLRRLLAIVGTIEAVAYELSIKCYETPTQEFCKYFTGKGRWPGGRDEKKAQTIAACNRLGWLDVGSDEADALALFSYAESIVAPRAAAQRRVAAGEELALDHHPETKIAPRPANRGAIKKSQPDEEHRRGRQHQSNINFDAETQRGDG